MPPRIIRLLCVSLGFAAAAADGQESPPETPFLQMPVPSLSAQGQEARVLIEGLGAAYRYPVVVEPEVKGLVTLEFHDTTVGAILDALCGPRGWSYETEPAGYLVVRRFVTRIYPVDYLQLAQSGSSSTSISLSDNAGQATVGAQPGFQGTAGPQAGLQLAGGTSQPGAASSALSLSSQNDVDFWGHLESDLKAMMGEGESLIVNRFAGLVQVRAGLRTHEVIRGYLDRVLQRAGRQAHISVKVLEVDLSDQTKTGIDWSLAASSLGRIAGTPLTLSGQSSSLGLPQAGSITYAAPVFTGTLGVGAVQATIQALSEQGTVRVESKPEVAALNNQTAFVQVSEDQPFFRRTSTTTINAGGSTQAGTQPIVNTNYTETTVSFGNVLEITVQIADDLATKLSISPAMTELKGTVVSPDGQETAPVTSTKRARTTVVLRNHETAVIGGFVTQTSASSNREVPLLRSLPVLGAAFSSKGRAGSKTELVFLVTVNAENPPELAPTDSGSWLRSSERQATMRAVVSRLGADAQWP
jgi:MSHA biogenesis protein MshL